jgi:hypothetical protein
MEGWDILYRRGIFVFESDKSVTNLRDASLVVRDDDSTVATA